MDIEDLVYGAGKKGRTKDGKSLKAERKEAVQDARVAASLKVILDGGDHSLLTRAMDPGSTKGLSPGKLLSNKEVASSAVASVNLTEDYVGVSPSDIAAFRSAHPLSGEFGMELRESYEYAERRASVQGNFNAFPLFGGGGEGVGSGGGGDRGKSDTEEQAQIEIDPRHKGEKKKEKKKKKAAQAQSPEREAANIVDTQGNFVSVPSSNFAQHRRKSLSELDYLYRSQVVKSAQANPEIRKYKKVAEATRMARSRGGFRPGAGSSSGSMDDGAGGGVSPTKKGKGVRLKGKKGGEGEVPTPAVNAAEDRKGWRYLEKPDDRRRREDRLHASLVRMFELQVKLEEERKASDKAKGGSSIDLLSLFRRSFWGGKEKAADALATATTTTATTTTALEARNENSRARKPPGKNATLFRRSLPKL